MTETTDKTATYVAAYEALVSLTQAFINLNLEFEEEDAITEVLCAAARREGINLFDEVDAAQDRLIRPEIYAQQDAGNSEIA